MSNHIEVLERLARLRETGALTEVEFQEQKAALLKPGGAGAGEHWFSKAWRETRTMRLVFWGVGIAMMIFVASAGAYWWSRGQALPNDGSDAAGDEVQAALPEIAKRTPFAEARRRLAAAGFEPAPIVLGNSCPGGVCRAYPEVVDCVGMGTSPNDELYAPCVYRYRRTSDGALLLVRSVGEYAPSVQQDVEFHSMGYLTEADAQQIRMIEEAHR